MEGHIELETVAGEVHAQTVGSGPAHVFAHVGGGHGEYLRQKRDAQEGAGGP